MHRSPEQHLDYFCIPTSLKAPLATFDTIDLGDEDVPLRTTVQTSTFKLESAAKRPCNLDTKIGGTHSKGRTSARNPVSGCEEQSPKLGNCDMFQTFQTSDHFELSD